MSKTLIIVLVIVGVLLVLGLVTYFIIQNKKEEEKKDALLLQILSRPNAPQIVESGTIWGAAGKLIDSQLNRIK